MKRALGALLVTLALVGCGRHAKPTPSPAQVQAQLLAAQQAADLLEKQRRERETAERLRLRQERLAQEFLELERSHAPTLSALQRWDAAGDARTEAVDQVLLWLPQVAQLQPMVEACGSRLLELADRPHTGPTAPGLAGRVRSQCDLAMRHRAILQRQVLAQARTFLGLPAWYTDIATRYTEKGRISWHQWLELLDLEQSYQRRAQPWIRAAAAVDAVLPTQELLAPGLQARAAMAAQLLDPPARLGLPAGWRDSRFAAQVRAAWPRAALSGPLAGLRGTAVEVVALDAAWQPLVDERGKVTRQLRELAARVEVVHGPTWAQGCWILWAALERQGSTLRLRWAEEVRKVRCLGPKPAAQLARASP